MFIVIFGQREHVTTHDRGQFFCRHCGAWREYAYRVRRPYFTLFFIRTAIPTGKADEYVQCLTCRQTFEPAALRYHPGR